MANENLPYFIKIRNYVENMIVSGQLQPSDQIPTEEELAEIFGVSRLTVKRALSELVSKKMIYRVKGKGSFVHSNDKGERQSNNQQKQVSDATPFVDIAIIMPEFSSNFGSTLLESIIQELYSHNYNAKLFLTFESLEKETEMIQLAIRQGAKGIIIFPVDSCKYNEEILRLTLDQYPHVLIDRYLRGIDNYSVCSDNAEGAYNAVQSLIRMGHRHIGIISPAMEGTVSLEDRFKGVMKVVEESLSDVRIYQLSNLDEKINTVFEGCPNREVIVSIQSFLQQYPEITALFSFNPAACLNVILSVKEMGKKIPDDISIISFDKISAFIEPQISFVEQDSNAVGETAVSCLLRLLKGEKVEKRTLIPTKLILQQSTTEIKK